MKMEEIIMNHATEIAMIAALVLSVVIPFGYFLMGKQKTRKRFKRAITANALFFFGTFVIATVVVLLGAPGMAFAEDTATATTSVTGFAYLAAALSTGLSCIGGGIAVASAASAALGAISEDGSIFGKSLIFAGLAEGICLYGLIISFMIIGRV